MKNQKSIIGDGKVLYENVQSKMGDKTMQFLSDCYEKTGDKTFSRAMNYKTEIVDQGIISEQIMEVFDSEDVEEQLSEGLEDVFYRMRKLAKLI